MNNYHGKGEDFEWNCTIWNKIIILSVVFAGWWSSNNIVHSLLTKCNVCTSIYGLFVDVVFGALCAVWCCVEWSTGACMHTLKKNRMVAVISRLDYLGIVWYMYYSVIFTCCVSQRIPKAPIDFISNSQNIFIIVMDITENIASANCRVSVRWWLIMNVLVRLESRYRLVN